MADVERAVKRLLKDLEYALSFAEAHKDKARISETRVFLFEQIARLRAGDLRGLDSIGGYFAPTGVWDDLGSDDGGAQCAIGARISDSLRYLRWHQQRQAFNDRWVARLRRWLYLTP